MIKHNTKHIIRALDKVMKEVNNQSKALILRSSTDYLIAVQSAIKNQTYADATWIHSPSYSYYKRQVAPNKPYWMLSDDLFKSIKNRKITVRSRFVGIQAGRINKEGFLISWYALKMEFGDEGRHTPRPVFGPSLNDYFNRKFQKRTEKTIQKITMNWK